MVRVCFKSCTEVQSSSNNFKKYPGKWLLIHLASCWLSLHNFLNINSINFIGDSSSVQWHARNSNPVRALYRIVLWFTAYGTPKVKLLFRFKSIKYHPPPIFHQHMLPNVCPGALSCLVHFKNQVPFLLLKGTQMWCSHELGPRPVKSWPSNANLLQVLVSTLGRLGGQSCIYYSNGVESQVRKNHAHNYMMI